MGSPPAIVRLSPSRRGVSRCARRGAHSGTCLLPRLHGPRLKPEPQPRVAGFDGHDRHGAVGWRGSDAGYAWTNRSDPRRARLNARIGQLSGCAGRRSSPVILSPLSLRRRNAVVERRCRRVPVRLDSGRATVPARRANRRSPQWKQVGARSAAQDGRVMLPALVRWHRARPPGAPAGGQGDRGAHRCVRRVRLRHTPGPVGWARLAADESEQRRTRAAG
jgi:hypothetical protein